MDGIIPFVKILNTGGLNEQDWEQVNTALGNLVDDQVTDLKAEKVDKDGEHQVMPQNIYGVTFDKEETEVEGENIFSESYLVEDGYYSNIDTTVIPNKITHGSNAACRWYAIPVDGISKYTFTGARFACLAKGNTLGSESIGELLENASEVTTTGASYLILTYVSSVTDIEIHQITKEYAYSNYVAPEWMTGDSKPKYASVSAQTMSNGDQLAIESVKNNLRKGERIVVSADITSFTQARLNYCYSSNGVTNFIQIDATYITVKNSSTAYTAHGLTIENNITLEVEYLDNATANITLTSNGNSYSHVFAFVKQAVAYPSFGLMNGSLTNVKMSWTCKDICKSIWFFGDSYVAYDSARWPYYLKEQGYDGNILLDGFPGEGSVNARVSFNNLLAFGTPIFAVWCMGMNDESDSESAPSANWVSGRDLFLQYCSSNNVTPIFATVPSVPSISHEQKNAWIRSSGYRYIDFAKAVGAQSDGTWFSGMLSSDNVHPTEQGARALFARVLLDLPEIMIDDFGY